MRAVSAAFRARSVGEGVPAHGCGRVHSAFARACNIEVGAELVTLLGCELGAAPHGITLDARCAPLDAWLRAGERALLEQAVLWLPDAGVAVDLSGALRWRGSAAPVAPDNAAVSARLRALHAILVRCAPQHGIAAALLRRAAAPGALERALAARLGVLLPALARASARRDADALAAAAACLVGLGPGLTPSGDDFLVGWLAALWSRATAEGNCAFLLRLGAILAPAFRRTHAISRQMLADASQGCFAQHLAGVTAALAGRAQIGPACEQALAHGHSSGADALCGVLFGYAPQLMHCAYAPRVARHNVTL